MRLVVPAIGFLIGFFWKDIQIFMSNYFDLIDKIVTVILVYALDRRYLDFGFCHAPHYIASWYPLIPTHYKRFVNHLSNV